MEIWKDIDGFEGLYQISDYGRVKSLKYNKSKILKPSVDKHGYLGVILYKNKTKTRHRIHRLVAKAFILNSNNLSQVNHKNGVKTCNEDWNLEWINNSGNQKHAFAMGLQTNVGSNNPSARKIDQFDLENNFVKQWASIYDITKELGYSRSSIWRCCTGKYKTSHGCIWRYAD